MGTALGKWTKHKLLLKEKKLVPYLPATKLLSEATFTKYLNRYGEAIIKPNRGSFGYGVFKVTDMGNDCFEIHGANRKEIFTGKKLAYDTIIKNINKRKMIIQRVIPLAKKDGHPFDIRVMVQRRKNTSNWVVTGKLAKVAGNGFFITNAAREVLTVEEAIQKSTIELQNQEIKNMMDELERASILIGETLQKYYPKRHEMGIDMGIDDEGHLWIIEVNLRPSISMFSLLRDKSMLKQIRQFRKKNS